MNQLIYLNEPKGPPYYSQPMEDEVLVLTFDSTKFTAEDVTVIYNRVKEIFPNTKILCLPNETSLTLYNIKELKQFLQSNLDKINIEYSDND